jgi:hypothetical protein
MHFKPKRRNGELSQPTRNRKVIELERIGPLDREIRVILATRLYGWETHFIDQTFPHTEPREKCRGCLKNNRRRPYFWLHVMHERTRRQTFVEFTNDGALDLIEVCAGRPMRGLRCMFSRIGGRQRASILTTVLGEFTERDSLPDARDPGATLSLLWNTLIAFTPEVESADVPQ